MARGTLTTTELGRGLARIARPLRAAADLDPLIERIGDARFVLLGEATHGTSEFYTWRARLSQRLIAEAGFSFVAVEGDWPDCARVHRYVTGRDGAPNAESILHTFDRWPTWMWANRETARFADWIRSYAAGRPADGRVGFHGLDVYSLWDSIRAVTEYLDRTDPALAAEARRAYACFDPYYEDAHDYARATALVPTSCAPAVIEVLRALRTAGGAHEPIARGEPDRDAFFDAEQNALIAKNAELYYRTMIRGGSTSWNVRDHHMVETLERLMERHGPGARAIVWEHNTHIGDARFTDMAAHGMVNVGQIVRERAGEEHVVLVGFGTHRGTVVAADEWGAPMQRMTVPPARPGSFEDGCQAAGVGDFVAVWNGADDGGIAGLEAPWEHRAIGVVYDSRRERWGNYVPSQLARRYDAFVFIEETQALDALHVPAGRGGEEETFPSGM